MKTKFLNTYLHYYFDKDKVLKYLSSLLFWQRQSFKIFIIIIILRKAASPLTPWPACPPGWRGTGESTGPETPPPPRPDPRCSVMSRQGQGLPHQGRLLTSLELLPWGGQGHLDTQKYTSKPSASKSFPLLTELFFFSPTHQQPRLKSTLSHNSSKPMLTSTTSINSDKPLQKSTMSNSGNSQYTYTKHQKSVLKYQH